MMMVMMVMRVLLLLLGWFCVGLSADEETYGEMLRIRLHRRAQTIEFSPKFGSDVKTVWEREGDDSWDSWSAWNKPMGDFVIRSLTQEDSGIYRMKSKLQTLLYSRTIDVVEKRESYERSAGESLIIRFNLDTQNCNIFFYPVPPKETTKTQIVRYGMLRDDADCSGFKKHFPCGLENRDLKMSCNGRFEFRDANDNTALVVNLHMKRDEQPTSEMSKVGLGFGIFVGILFCCTCVKCCCGGGDSSTEKEGAETPADTEPITSYQESDSQPVRPRSAQPSPRLPAQRPRTPTGPQIHSRPRKPPAYSKIKNEGSGHETNGNQTNEGVPIFQKMGSTPKTTLDIPTVPIHIESDDEPRFELKGVTFPSLLGSDSTCADVYNSDKLNFL